MKGGKNNDHHAGLSNPVRGLNVAHTLSQRREQQGVHWRTPPEVRGTRIPEVPCGFEVHRPVAAPGVIEGWDCGKQASGRDGRNQQPRGLACNGGQGGASLGLSSHGLPTVDGHTQPQCGGFILVSGHDLRTDRKTIDRASWDAERGMSGQRRRSREDV